MLSEPSVGIRSVLQIRVRRAYPFDRESVLASQQLENVVVQLAVEDVGLPSRVPVRSRCEIGRKDVVEVSRNPRAIEQRQPGKPLSINGSYGERRVFLSIEV